MRSRSIRRRAYNVHEIRKRLKETRAIVPLIASGARARWIAHLLRDIGRELSASREADSAIETFHRLRLRRRIDASAYEAVNAALASDCITVDLRPLRARLTAAREEIARWPAGETDVDRVVQCVYRSARKRMNRALRTGAVDDFHDWRKKTKQHWYQTAYVADPDPRRDSLRALSRALGSHHDMMVLRAAIERHADRLEPKTRAVIVAAAKTRAAKLEEQVIALGALLFSEPARIRYSLTI